MTTEQRDVLNNLKYRKQQPGYRRSFFCNLNEMPLSVLRQLHSVRWVELLDENRPVGYARITDLGEQALDG